MFLSISNLSIEFSYLGFWSGNFFLIVPFPDHCLLVSFNFCTLPIIVNDKLAITCKVGICEVGYLSITPHQVFFITPAVRRQNFHLSSIY